MTEMTEAQTLMADVIGGHRYSIMDSPVHRCICGEDIGRDPDAIDEHRAREIDKALGGLTREERIVEGVFEMGVPEPAVRWVSGWSEAQS